MDLRRPIRSRNRAHLCSAFFYLKISFTLIDMTLSWALKRRMAVLSFVGVIFILFLGFTWYSTYQAPSCFDKKQNQDEEGVDCGEKVVCRALQRSKIRI